jgi:hypothetical protein
MIFICNEEVYHLTLDLIRYPYSQKSENERIVQEMLEVGIIQPSQSTFSSLVVMIHINEGLWCMCLEYRELNKITINDTFHIHINDDLLDELQGAIFLYQVGSPLWISSNQNEARIHPQNNH